MDRLRAYLQLMRFPAVFTAMADIFLGFLLTHTGLEPADRFGLLLAASSCLYLAGMVFNDVFDRETDTQERPERPIPSRRVSVKNATGLGVLLILAGIAAASAVTWQSLRIALMLAGAIFAYDWFLKKTLLGPVAMGGCRFLNVMLGASASNVFVWSKPQTLVAVCLGIYIAGVTWFARMEARQSSRIQLAGATGIVNLGLIGLSVLIVQYPWRGDPHIPLMLMLLAAIVLVIDRRLWKAVVDPIPGKVQSGVKTMLLSLVLIDATLVLVHTGELRFAILTATLLLPATFLGRWIYVT